MPYKNDFPTIAVRDIQIHPRDRDLLVGTHGRGLWILDDIRPMEELTPEVLDSDLYLFDIRPATLYSYASSSMYSGPHEYSAPNPAFGACINYYIKESPKAGDEFKLSILDTDGREISALRATRNKGINRVYWNLREQGTPPENQETSGGGRFRRFSGGPFALPGEYKAVLQLGDQKIEKDLTVLAFERHQFSVEEREINRKYAGEITRLMIEGGNLISSMNDLMEQLENLSRRLASEKVENQGIKDKLNSIKSKVAEIQQAFSYSVEGATGYKRPVIVALRGGTLPEQISRLRGSISRYQGAPTQTQIDQFNDIKQQVDPLLQRATEIRELDIPQLNKLLNEINFPFIKVSR
jgi:hypothetical protein